MKTNKIHLCFACDNHYALYAAVVLHSVLKTKGPTDEFCVWVISDHIQHSRQQWFKNLFPQIAIHFVEVPVEFMKGAQVVKEHLALAAYARLALGSVLPVGVERIIYLDCDLVVLESLRPLWNWDLHGKVAAGLEDWGVGLLRRENKFFFYDKEIYIGSGLLVVDVKRWREVDAEKRIKEYMLCPAYPIQHEDQDVLNFALHGHLGVLPARWDVVVNISAEELKGRHSPPEWIAALQQPAVVHFAGPDKPWLDICKQPYKELFRQYMGELQLSIEKVAFKIKLKHGYSYWWNHPICFLKPTFWKRIRKYGWRTFW